MDNELKEQDLWIEFTEEVTDHLSEDFYQSHKEWVDESGQFADLLNLFYTWNIPAGKTAKLIEGCYGVLNQKLIKP